MSLKEKILEVLDSNKGTYLSGEELASSLEVTRTAVWKAIKQLQQEGFNIIGINNKGYCLSKDTDIVTINGISKYLDNKDAFDIQVLSSIGSTNTAIKEMNIPSLKDGFTLIANEQTAGRGRRGRSFFSPKGTGIYMSILLKPDRFLGDKAIKITTMAASALCEAIKDCSSVEPKIKWVNDIFVNNKKACGILTEASFDLETGYLDYAILGVGINMYKPEGGFPSELEDIAGSIFDKKESDLKNKLVGSFLNHFIKFYKADSDKEYIELYKNYSLAVGHNVNVIRNDKVRRAFVNAIDDECRLLVTYLDDGTDDVLSYGEISIKL